MQQRAYNHVQRFFNQGSCPATRALLAANAATFLLFFFAQGRGPWDRFVFRPDQLLAQPWTVLTYALISIGDFVNVFFSGLILYWFGGSLERTWGPPRYVRFVAAATMVSALGFGLGYQVVDVPVPLVGLWLPVAAVTLAWCLLHPESFIYLWFVIPVKGKWLMWFELGALFFRYGFVHPLLGLFALAGCGYAYLSVRGWAWWRPARPAPRSRSRFGTLELNDKPRRPTLKRTWNPFARFERWRRKRRFMRLWQEAGLEERIGKGREERK